MEEGSEHFRLLSLRRELQKLIDLYGQELWEYAEIDLERQKKYAVRRFKFWQFIELPDKPTPSTLRRLIEKMEKGDSGEWQSELSDRLRDIRELEREIRACIQRCMRALLDNTSVPTTSFADDDSAHL